MHKANFSRQEFCSFVKRGSLSYGIFLLTLCKKKRELLFIGEHLLDRPEFSCKDLPFQWKNGNIMNWEE